MKNIGNRNCQGENGNRRPYPRRQTLFRQDHPRLFHKLEDTPLYPRLQFVPPFSSSPIDVTNQSRYSTIWQSPGNFVRLLAESTQQERPTTRIHHPANRQSPFPSIFLPTYWQQQNEYPTIGNAFIAVYSLLAVWISDGPLRGRRWPTIIFGHMVAIVIFVLLVMTPVIGPFSHRAPLYIVASIGSSAVPLTMA